MAIKSKVIPPIRFGVRNAANPGRPSGLSGLGYSPIFGGVPAGSSSAQQGFIPRFGAASTAPQPTSFTPVVTARPSQGIMRYNPSGAYLFGRYGYTIDRAPEIAGQLEEGWKPGATTTTTTSTSTTANQPTRQTTAAAPPGVNIDWYAEFQRQHGGQTPEQYYAKTGEGLAEAMADEEWARGFAEMYGRPPTDDDWRAHWFSTRVGYTPEEYEKWKMRQIVQQEIQRQQEQQQPEPEPEPEQRAPIYQPQYITWR